MAISKDEHEGMSSVNRDVAIAIVKTLSASIPALMKRHGLDEQLTLIAISQALALESAAHAAQAMSKDRQWASDLGMRLIAEINSSISKPKKGGPTGG